MDLVPNTGGIIGEPEWTRFFRRKGERDAAAGYWTTIVEEMRSRQTLSPANAHAIQRLVLALVIYDRTAATVARQGAVNEPAKGNARDIPRVSPYFIAAQQAAAMIAAAEVELGLTPRRRNSAGKIAPAKRKPTGADRYLKSLDGGRSATPETEKEKTDAPA